MADYDSSSVEAGRGHRWLRILVRVLVVLLALAAIPTCYVGYRVYRAADTIAQSNVFDPPPTQPGFTLPIQPPIQIAALWKPQKMTILLLGVDRRQDEPTRSDTMLIITIDPEAKTASMLSVPRDLWVTIPGHGQERVNAAYTLGEIENGEKAAPDLAKQTVEANFGIKIDRYALVDFHGFEKIVDTVGGVNIDVPRPLKDNEYPSGDWDYQRIFFFSGLQHMDGRTALQYARERHSDSDFGRNQRQQQVLLALREQSLQLGLIGKLDELVQNLSDSVRTDMRPEEAIGLARLVPQIGSDSIFSRVIDETLVRSWVTPAGADVLLPNWEEIRPMVAALVSDPRLLREGARVQIQNGTGVSNLAARTAEQLSRQGFAIVGSVQAPAGSPHPTTSIVRYTDKAYTADKLAHALGLQADAVTEPPAGATARPGVDIVVVLGDDWADKMAAAAPSPPAKSGR